MRFRNVLASVAALALLAGACASDDKADKKSDKADTTNVAPGKDAKKVGFLYVGSKDDFGYNQAAYEGAEAVAKAFPDVEVIHAENVPENAEVERVMEKMIKDGATIIFPTSYGHLTPALAVAKKHPDVVVVHQGGLEPDPKMANVGTYFGTVYEPVYLAGIAAGKATATGKLGYVAAIPIPQTLANVNAFTLGAQSVRPDATTTVVFTKEWCSPSLQAEAARSLLGQGIDVTTQHQDCTKTIIETTEAAGKMSVGYHYDASELAPKGWVAGSEWSWGPLYVDIVKTIRSGKFTGSKYDGDYRAGLRTGDNPFVASKVGSMVDAATSKLMDDARTRFGSGGGSPFVGPVYDQDGKVKVPAGETPDYATIEQMDYLVKGVIGTLPS